MKILHVGREENIKRYISDWQKNGYADIVSMPVSASVGEMIRKAEDAEYLIADAVAPVTEELINGLPQLKMIHSEGVAFNSFDIEAAAARRIYVCNCKGMNAMAVAEQTVLLMLGTLKNIRSGDIAVRSGHQISEKEGYMARGDLMELADMKIGLIGFGDIAKAVAKLMHAFGAETFYYSRHRASEETEKEYNVKYLPFDELCRSCMMFSIHVPVTAETVNKINREFFEKIPEGSYIVNTARGEVMDAEALVAALETGKVKAAGLDTLTDEPVRPDNFLLRQPDSIKDKLLFSPHIGGITASSFRRGYDMIRENIERMEHGEKPLRTVNSW